MLDAAAFDILGTLPRHRYARPAAACSRARKQGLLRGGNTSGGLPGNGADTPCRGGSRAKPRGQRIRVVATDERLGKLVGAILHQAGLAVIGSLMRMWLLSARHLMPHWCCQRTPVTSRNWPPLCPAAGLSRAVLTRACEMPAA